MQTEYNPVDDVTEFNTKFETSDDTQLWVKLVKEELAEAEEAFAAFVKEVVDLLYVGIGLQLKADPDEAEGYFSDDDARRIDQMTDIVRDGIPSEILAKAFSLVHASNMSKLGEDGKPVRREDGKIMKGPNYREPDLLPLVRGQ